MSVQRLVSSECEEQATDTNDLDEITNSDAENFEFLEENSLVPVDYSVKHSNKATQTVTNSILHIPRSNAEPVSIYDLKFGDESAFPWLFPTGTNGFCQTRQAKLCQSMYFRTRLYNYRGHWRKDIMYLLHATAFYDISMLKGEIGIF